MTLIKFDKEFLVVCLRRWQINRKKVFCCLTLCIDIVIQGLGFQAIGSGGKVNSSAPIQLLSRSSPIMPLLIQSMPWSVWSVYRLTSAYTYTQTRGKRFHWSQEQTSSFPLMSFTISLQILSECVLQINTGYVWPQVRMLTLRPGEPQLLWGGDTQWRPAPPPRTISGQQSRDCEADYFRC